MDLFGRTPLHVACIRGDYAALLASLSSSSDLDPAGMHSPRFYYKS
jgi:ankyrin repeat protein